MQKRRAIAYLCVQFYGPRSHSTGTPVALFNFDHFNIKNGHVEGPNLPFLTRHACGHCRQPTVWLCCCIGWYLTPFCTSTHVLCVQILKANGWMTCHCWLTIAHRYRSIWRGQLANYVASWHPGARTTREINQRGHADHIGKPRTCTAERAAGSVRRRPATVKPSD